MRFFSLFALLFVSLSCGSSSPTGGNPDSATPANDSGDTSSAFCAAGTGPAPLTGTWALKARLAGMLRGVPGAPVALCPDPQTANASLYMRIRFSAAGNFMTELCEISLPVIEGGTPGCPTIVRTTIEPSAGLKAVLPMLPIPGMASPPAIAGDRWMPAPLPFIIGAQLSAPNAALPSWQGSRPGCDATDAQATACVSDFASAQDTDNDGHPGVTVNATSDPAFLIMGQAYVALRTVPTLSGAVKNDSCVEGDVSAGIEYGFVGSDLRLNGGRASTALVTQVIPPITVEPGKFRMLRTNGTGDLNFDTDNDGQISCTEIKAKDRLFGQLR